MSRDLLLNADGTRDLKTAISSTRPFWRLMGYPKLEGFHLPDAHEAHPISERASAVAEAQRLCNLDQCVKVQVRPHTDAEASELGDVKVGVLRTIRAETIKLVSWLGTALEAVERMPFTPSTNVKLADYGVPVAVRTSRP